MSELLDYQFRMRDAEYPQLERPIVPIESESVNSGIPRLLQSVKAHWWYYLLVTLLATAAGYWVASEYGWYDYTAYSQVRARTLPAPPGKPYFTPPTIKEFSRYLYDPQVLSSLKSVGSAPVSSKKKKKLFEDDFDLKTGVITIKLIGPSAEDASAMMNQLISESINKSNEERKATLNAALNYYISLAGGAEAEATSKRQAKTQRLNDLKSKFVKDRGTELAFDELTEILRVKRADLSRLESELSDAQNLKKVLLEEEKMLVTNILNNVIDGFQKKAKMSATEFAPGSRQAAEIQRKAEAISELASKGASNYEGLTKLLRELGQIGQMDLDLSTEDRFALNRISGNLFEIRNKMLLLPQKIADTKTEIASKVDQRSEMKFTTDLDIEKIPEILELSTQIERAEKNAEEIMAAIEWVKDMQTLDTPAYEQMVTVTPESTIPDGNHLKLFAAVFGAVGVFFGFPLLMYDMLSSKLTATQKLGNEFGLSTIATHEFTGRGHAKTSLQDRDPELRLLALRIQNSARNARGSVVLFSSLSDRVSTKELTTTLARCLVARQERVLILDLEPIDEHRRKKRRPAIGVKSNKSKNGNGADQSGKLSVVNSESESPNERMGLAMALSSQSNSPDVVLVEHGIDGIDRVHLGGGELPMEAFASPLMTKLLDTYRNEYSMVLLSGPAAKHLADVQMLASRCDGTLFVAPSRGELSQKARRTVNELLESRNPILGIAEVPS